MRYKVLVTAPYMQLVIDRFRHIFEGEDIELIVPPFQERFEEEELLELVEGMDGVICGDDRFTECVLRAAPQLKVLSKWGTGIDSIDQAACRDLGVAVCNTPKYRVGLYPKLCPSVALGGPNYATGNLVQGP
jgi:D-3-phosphoglycerate dehydrogenase